VTHPKRRWHRGTAVVAVASVSGLAAFFYPFLLPVVATTAPAEQEARSGAAPFVLGHLVFLCLLAIVAELSAPRLIRLGAPRAGTAKMVALLGALVAVDATLRLVPTLLGASPIFLLILLTGATFGPSFGFIMGALTLLVSAFLTGGLGPWLPYQMLGAGWVGLTAGWLPTLPSPRRQLLLLAAFGALWGLVYGALLNLYAWPFASPGLQTSAGLYWSPGLSIRQAITHYVRFYLVTSLTYDLLRAIGNAVLVLTVGPPLLRILGRTRSRFAWEAGAVADQP
jgi:energy-coupling factor transport system substrate-specific component